MYMHYPHTISCIYAIWIKYILINLSLIYTIVTLTGVVVREHQGYALFGAL